MTDRTSPALVPDGGTTPNPMDRLYKAKALANLLAEYSASRVNREYSADERTYVHVTACMIADALEETAWAMLEELHKRVA